MRQRTIIFFFIFSILYSFSFSQDVSVHWGKMKPTPKKSYIGKMLGTDNSGFYLLRFQKKGWGKSFAWLERYNNSLNLDFSEELFLPDSKGQELSYEKLYYLGNKLLLFSSYFDKANGINYAYANDVSLKGKVSKKSVLVDSILVKNKRKTGSFDFAISNDSSKFLIYHNEPYLKGINEKFSYNVRDASMNSIWRKKFELPYKEEDYIIQDYKIDNDGNVFQLGKIYKSKEEKQKKSPEYKYVLMAYYHKTNLLKEFEIDLNDKFISEISFKLDNRNTLVCSGFFSNRSNQEIYGVFYLQIDNKTKQVIARGTTNFDDQFLLKFMSQKRAKKGKELSSFKLRDFIMRDDGGVILLAEQYHMNVSTTTDPNTGTTRTTYYYYYNDIIVVNVNPDATIAWSKVIPKRQVSINDGGYYLSYAKAIVKNKIFIIYNDNNRNISEYTRNNLRYFGNPRKGMVTLVTMNSNGEFKKTQILNNNERQFALRPKLSVQVSQTELLIYGESGKNYKFGSLKFNTD